jgi:hypothetical protein
MGTALVAFAANHCYSMINRQFLTIFRNKRLHVYAANGIFMHSGDGGSRARRRRPLAEQARLAQPASFCFCPSPSLGEAPCRLSSSRVASKAGRTRKQASNAPRRKAVVAQGKAPLAAEDFAKQQIARLEQMIEALIEKANDGELGAIDRILKTLDRLDRYQGFSPASASAGSEYDARERILQKLSDVDARRAAAEDEADRGSADEVAGA